MPHPAGFEDERLCRVTFRQGAHAVSGEKFRLVQRPPQQRLHAMAAQQREQDAIAPCPALPNARLVAPGPAGA